ncbi:hypothetical protein [Methanoculleus sediminis]|uniref:hypothetical protein n=1 Tax=Methanoculleus sediminis TaxID=1550566 RepID=UPI000B00CC69|nr:hypothetical protein [Methanoculleus sediminis]
MDIRTAGLLVCSHGSGPASGLHRYGLLDPARSRNLTDAVVSPVPVKPFMAVEKAIREIYRTSLTGLYRKPTG